MTVEIPLSRGLVALVDDDDAALIGQYSWYAHLHYTIWYAVRRERLRRADGTPWRRYISMHKFLTGYVSTDHVNGNGLDNRRANLRRASVFENSWNARKKRGSSRYKGVVWDPVNRRWTVRICSHGRYIWLGRFDDETAAALAYDAAARLHHGEFAALNFPLPGERSALESR